MDLPCKELRSKITIKFQWKFIQSTTFALNCGMRWIHHEIFRNTELGDKVKAMHPAGENIKCPKNIWIQNFLFLRTTSRSGSWCGLLGQKLCSLLLVHLHQHPLLICQVVPYVCDFSWKCKKSERCNWEGFKPVPMVPPWSLIVKCCPASRTMGFSSLVTLSWCVLANDKYRVLYNLHIWPI